MNIDLPLPETDCMYEVLRRTMAGLEYAMLNPGQASSVMADLHDMTLHAYVDRDGGRKALEQIFRTVPPERREFTYLASPYSASGEHARCIEKERFEQVCVVGSDLFRRGTHVFCPISHSHPIRDIGGMLPGSFSFWETYDQRMLAMCDTLTVCKLDGWQESVGVTAEVAIAKALGKPIREIDPAPILEKWAADHNGLLSHFWPHTHARKP